MGHLQVIILPIFILFLFQKVKDIKQHLSHIIKIIYFPKLMYMHLYSFIMLFQHHLFNLFRLKLKLFIIHYFND